MPEPFQPPEDLQGGHVPEAVAAMGALLEEFVSAHATLEAATLWLAIMFAGTRSAAEAELLEADVVDFEQAASQYAQTVRRVLLRRAEMLREAG